jgi:GT2 family glycosyltransferase
MSESLVPGINIVIINLNLKNDTAECINSLLEAKAKIGEVIVVDNGSSDGSAQFLREKYGPELEIIGLNENLGFAEGSNFGLKKAFSRGATWLLLMNNDTLVAPDFLEKLAEAVVLGNEYRLFSPLIFYLNPSDVIWSVTNRLIPGTMIGYDPYIGKKKTQFSFPTVLPADFINGCSMLVHREVFEKIGFFDPRLFIYHEEVDLSWRARQAGFRMAIATQAEMWHKISAVMSKQKPKTRYLQTRNQIWVYRRHARGLQLPIMFVFTVLRTIRLAIHDALKNQSELLPYLWQGFQEGWTSDPNPGRMSF